MCTPFFQIKKFAHENKIFPFSSNYALYGDLSRRVMQVISHFSPDIEVYSIDEAFLNLENVHVAQFEEFALLIKKTIYSEVGIPVSIGIAPTKVLAKVATSFAKKKETGVFVIDKKMDLKKILHNFPCKDIWGIGDASALKLKLYQINDAWAFVNADEKLIQKILSITGKKILFELKGEKAIDFVIEKEGRQQILSSKSFEHSVFDKKTISEAISNHAFRATEKLRSENKLAQGISVFIQTHPLKDGPQYYNSELSLLVHPIDHYPQIVDAAVQGFEKIFRSGFEYKKCGVALINLKEKTELQLNLFESSKESVNDEKSGKNISQILDSINKKFGTGSITLLACGMDSPWKHSGNLKSKSYTTNWKELPPVF